MDAPRLYRRASTLPALVRGVVFKMTLTALAGLVAWPVHEGFPVGGLCTPFRPGPFSWSPQPWDVREFFQVQGTGPRPVVVVHTVSTYSSDL